jgi:hypothetical protein
LAKQSILAPGDTHTSFHCHMSRRRLYCRRYFGTRWQGLCQNGDSRTNETQHTIQTHPKGLGKPCFKQFRCKTNERRMS